MNMCERFAGNDDADDDRVLYRLPGADSAPHNTATSGLKWFQAAATQLQ